MENGGNNRYELLFMDDDGGITVEPVVNKKVQQTAGKPAAPKKPKPATANNVTNGFAEKENKVATLNKVDSKRKSGPENTIKNVNNKSSVAKKVIPLDGTNKQKRNDGEQSTRSVNFKSGGGEVNRDQRAFRERKNFSNFGNSGKGEESGNDQRPIRQFNRDRENRGPPRKREFDRQSGSDKTGVKAVDKRDGAGAHNWGSVKQEIEDINKANIDGDAALTDKEDPPNEQSPEQLASAEEDASAKQLTLDEWKALRGERAKPQYNLRKAGEGEDTTQWKKMVVLNKKKDGDNEEEFEYDPSLYPQRVGRVQRIVDIQFNFNDGRRVGGIRGGGVRGQRRNDKEGRFEDGRPAKNPDRPRNFNEKPQRKTAYAPKVDDERQFPTLN